jgi:hypothetical protein
VDVQTVRQSRRHVPVMYAFDTRYEKKAHDLKMCVTLLKHLGMLLNVTCYLTQVEQLHSKNNGITYKRFCMGVNLISNIKGRA